MMEKLTTDQGLRALLLFALAAIVIALAMIILAILR